MKNEVACARCGTTVSIEEAYPRRPKGFHCENCHDGETLKGWVVGFVVLIIILLMESASR